MDVLKKKLLQNYVQQQNTLNPNTPSGSVMGVSEIAENTLVLYDTNNISAESITLEDFKNYVKKWLEYDNFIKKSKDIIKEKKECRDKLSDVITKFMVKYNIEDLNTKEGRIRCKQSYKKAPVSQKIVKERITDYFARDNKNVDDILFKVFEDREKVEQISLRRLKIS
jgi:hypothetical protein